MIKYIVIYFFFCSVFLSCSNVHEDDLLISEPAINQITFQDVSSIFQNNCVSCHSNPPTNGASVPLTTYNFVITAIENENLIARINSNQPGFAMPLSGPKLPQNLIDLIEQWEENGLLFD